MNKYKCKNPSTVAAPQLYLWHINSHILTYWGLRCLKKKKQLYKYANNNEKKEKKSFQEKARAQKPFWQT